MASTASAKTESIKEQFAAKPSCVPALCLNAALKHAKRDALNHKSDDDWIHIAAEDFVERVRNVALGLADLGIKPGDRVALLSENRPEWSIADLAILSLGAINVPIYTTQAVDQIRYILTDSGTRAIFVSNRKLFKHAQEALEGLDFLEKIIFFDEPTSETIARSTTLAAVAKAGQERSINKPAAFSAYVNAIHPEDLATIIYTSGTTGAPKGVMLTHANFVSNVLTISGGLPISATDTALSVLPLSHIFERTGFYIFCYCGVSVYYTASFDQLGENLREVKPTVMTAVPRLFENVYHRIVKKGLSQKGWKRRVFERSLTIGQRYGEARDKRKLVGPALAIQQKMASSLVFSKWREGVGGRLRYFVSGGAPLSPALSYAFLAAGIPILQGYGATESCIVSANRPDNNRVGSVGLPFAGIDVKIAADGEILLRGPNVMRGYYGHPEETASVLNDGWFATGDVGHVDKEGHLYITDRKKDLFKLSNGKYVAPQQIESLLKQSEFVSQVVVVGAGRKQPVALPRMFRRIIATSSTWVTVPLRLALAAVFFAHGSQKVLGILGGPGLNAFVRSGPAPFGFMRPAWFWLGAAALSEFLGSILIFLGLLTRVGAFFIACVMLTAIAGFHWPKGFFANTGGYEYPLALLGMALALLIAGGGMASIDRSLSGRRRR